MGRPVVIQLSHRYFYGGDQALLHYNGFTIEECYGDFDDEPLIESDSMVMVCRLSENAPSAK